MSYKIINKNARIALKQVKFENAKSNGVLSNYFINLENKRDLEINMCNNLKQTITTHLE